MKGYILKNNTNKTLVINVKKIIKIEPKSVYFYSGEILTGQIKLLERNNYISIEFVENYNINLENNNESIVVEKNIIDVKVENNNEPIVIEKESIDTEIDTVVKSISKPRSNRRK